VFGLEFIECFKRSNRLVNAYYQKISDISMEMNLQDEATSDPSFLLGTAERP
jgi:hypothetical protein